MLYLKHKEIISIYKSTQHSRVKTGIHSANVDQCGHGPGSLKALGGHGGRQVNEPLSTSTGCLKLLEEIGQRASVAGAVTERSNGKPVAGHSSRSHYVSESRGHLSLKLDPVSYQQCNFCLF